MSILEKKANIAVIGVGYWGKNIARNFSQLGVLHCLCDPYLETSGKIAAQYSVPILSFKEILQDKEISAVAIVTPAVTHYRLAKESLEAGKHVFVEKPMTLNFSHARELCKLAKAKRRKLMVGHLLQYHPVFVKLKELVRSNKLGKLQYLYSNRLDLGKIYMKKDVLWNLAPHDLSMILSLVHTNPMKVNATASCNLRDGISDFATIHMKFPNKIKAHVSVSWLNPFKEHKLTVIGTKGMVVFDDTQTKWEEKLAVYNHKVELEEGSIITIKEAPQFIEVEKSEPLKNECQHFINCIEQDKTPLTDGEEAFRVMEVLTQARACISSCKKEFV